MTENEAAVIAAAKQWLFAKELMLAHDEGAKASLPEDMTIDEAEYELTDAVYRLLGREAQIPRV